DGARAGEQAPRLPSDLLPRRGTFLNSAQPPTGVLCGPILAAGIRLLRLPRLKPGGSDRLALSCFRLRGQRFTGRGRSPRAVSGDPSTGRARPKPAPVAPCL